MHLTTPILTRMGRTAAMTFFAAATGLLLQAQTPSGTATSPVPSLSAAATMPAGLFDSAASSSSSSSSSSADATDALAAERFTLSDNGMQPPPRRRYGRPRYTDGMHNADGSNKYTFQFGGGFTLPTGGTHSYYTTSYDIQAGVGRNFNKNFALMLDFNWANFGMKQDLLNYQIALYNSLGAYDDNGDPLSQLGGYGHLWSFSLDPVYNFAQGERGGAYVTGGVGFYHKVSAFTIPSLAYYYSYYYGYIPYQANEPIDTYVSNAVGVNAGVGYTYKLSHFSNTKLFAEAKYVYTANSRRPYSEGSATNPYFNVFTQNSAPTSYIPITFGVRF